MTQRERETLTEPDPHSLLFGPDDDTSESPAHPSGEHVIASRASRRTERHEHAHRRRVRRHRRVFLLLTALLVVVVVVIAFTGYRIYETRYHPKDYGGAGVGAVLVVVHPGDGASAIGTTLRHDGVVASARAFSNAADGDAAAKNISPGTYRLRKHMSAKSALSLMLDPTARLSNKVVVTEGATLFDVERSLAKALGISASTVKAAVDNVSALGLPRGYTSAGRAPSSVEGFLYPATYNFDPGTKVGDALQEMITRFTEKARSTGFTADAQALPISPYQALIIASIIEREAKATADYPKVARVILNRLAADRALQIDATTRYGAQLNGLDPNKVAYDTYATPYNSYTHRGLPPSPISSPGESAMTAAVHPAAGRWMYYVNGDAQGDLFFTSSPAEFQAAVEKCRANNWGCG